jgi:predicted nucleic acid-binding protein
MLVYVDTSLLAAYYTPEPLSGKAEDFLAGQERPAISSLTELELFSALSRKVREEGLHQADAGKVAARFLSHLEADYFIHLPVEINHYRLARDWLGLFNNSLRSLDALHLAVASSHGLAVATADVGLSKSAQALGLEVVLLSVEAPSTDAGNKEE